MNKQPAYIDEILDVRQGNTKLKGNMGLIVFFVFFAVMLVLPNIISLLIFGMASFYTYTYTCVGRISGNNDRVESSYTQTNIDIYGKELYLDDIGNNTYVICTESDDYEKHLTWDYGADSYYDYDSDCYIWYNTDVSPNLWQYWYDDIAGDNYYGWMECEKDEWYIEVSDTDWELYEGDTSDLWHIENSFDKE